MLLSIPAGMGNTYTYDVPKNMPNGLYWYHSHRHTMTAQQTYAGLAGLLEIGRPDGNLPLVTQNDIPVRDMAIAVQLRVRPQRARAISSTTTAGRSS